MEIPPTALEQLKCNHCENYLSRGPIFLEHDGAASCGRCFSPKRPATRNQQYETAAKLLLFPCKNRELGCLEKVPFVDASAIIAHEEVCPFRPYVCPILGSAHCDWVGSRTELQKHCEEKHSERVKDNPITLKHDLSKSAESNYLLLAFRMLFLLHTKVCVTSRKIYHAIRYLGESDKATDFTFKTDIRRNGQLLSKTGNVLDQGCLVIQEDVSQVLDVNSLLNVLDGYEGTTFTITIETSASTRNLCAKCGALVKVLPYHSQDGWWCLSCAPAKEKCEKMSRGRECKYKDIPLKTIKHSQYFCEHFKYCHLCLDYFNQGSLLTHYNLSHQNKIHRAGSAWKTKWTEKGELVLLTCVAGTAVCCYFLNNNRPILHLYIPVKNNKLHEFSCEVRLLQIATGTVHTYKPETEYGNIFDWYVEIRKEDFPNSSREFNICVDIITNKTTP